MTDNAHKLRIERDKILSGMSGAPWTSMAFTSARNAFYTHLTKPQQDKFVEWVRNEDKRAVWKEYPIGHNKTVRVRMVMPNNPHLPEVDEVL